MGIDWQSTNGLAEAKKLLDETRDLRDECELQLEKAKRLLVLYQNSERILVALIAKAEKEIQGA